MPSGTPVYFPKLQIKKKQKTSELPDPFTEGCTNPHLMRSLPKRPHLYAMKFGELRLSETGLQPQREKSTKDPNHPARGHSSASALETAAQCFCLYLPALCNHNCTGTHIINSLYFILIHATSNHNKGVKSPSPLFLSQHRLQ